MFWPRGNHWKRFCLLWRLLGWGFLIGGVIFALAGTGLLLDKTSTILVNGVPTNDPAHNAIFLGIGLVTGVLGSLLLIAKPPAQSPDEDA
jgi:hypothetical protein